MALADNQIESVTDIVNSKLDLIQQWATKSKLAADTAIDGVGTFTLPGINMASIGNVDFGEPKQLSGLGSIPDPSVENNPASVTFTATGNVSQPDLVDIPSAVYAAPVVPDDRPSITLPQPPTAYPVAALPTQPAPDTVVDVKAPVITATAPPALVPVTIPTIEFPTIPPFSVAFPQKSVAKQDLDAKMAKIDSLISSVDSRLVALRNSSSSYDTGLRSKLATFEDDLRSGIESQRARMVQEAASNIDFELTREVRKVMVEYAARNFSLIPGMAVDKVNEIELLASRKLIEETSKVNTELSAQAAEDAQLFANMYYELEQNLIDVYLLQCDEQVELEKIRVQAQIELFNATLALFNAERSDRQMVAEAYKAELQANLELVGAYKVQVEGATADVAENDARTQIYNAQVEALRPQIDVYKADIRKALLPLEIYKTRLAGLKSQSDVALGNIEAYREAVKAYVAAVDASSSEVKAYAAQVQAVSSSVGVSETNSRAYTANIQELLKRSDTSKTFVAAQSDVMNANLLTFRTAADVNEGFVKAQAARIAAQAELVSTRTNAYGQYANAQSVVNKTFAQLNEAKMSNSMAAAEHASRVNALNAQARAEQEKMNAGALAAKAQALAGLAQGAMSALHVSASASGTGSTSSSAGVSYGLSSNWGGGTSKSETYRQILSA